MIKAAVAGLALILILTTTAGDDSLNKFQLSNCGFTLELLKTLTKENDNVLLSPVSINVLLTLIQQGAKGSSVEQLSHAIGLSPEDSRAGYGNLLRHLEKTKSNTILEWGNRAYISPNFQLNTGYQKLIADYLKTEIQHLNFGSPDASRQINNWVANVTHDKITNLVGRGTLHADTVMVLVNAIYFKGLWAHPFHLKRTKPAQFRLNKQNEVQVPFMHQVEEYIAGEDTTLGVKWVELTFSKDEYSMVFVLPTEDHKLDELINKMTPQDLVTILTTKTKKNVRLRLPKFKLSRKTSLTNVLKKVGVIDIFTDQSDLSGISSSSHLAVSDILHEAAIEINEEGSTASAATAGLVYVLSLDWNRDEMSFNANQPFLFFILDTTHRTPIFAGKIINPSV